MLDAALEFKEKERAIGFPRCQALLTMPDENENQPPLLAPPIEVAPPPDHEPDATSTATPETGRTQKILQVADRVAAKFGIKRGRGRPRSDGTPKKSDVVLTPDGQALPARENVSLAVAAETITPTADAQLLHRCLIGLAKGAVGGLNDAVQLIGEQAGLDAPYLLKLRARAEPDADALANFSEALDAVLKKRGINTANAPEWSLGLAAARIAAPYGFILLELRKEIARKREAEKGERV